MSMSFEQAMDVLQRMRSAAPPIAASKLEGVIDLLSRLQSETQSQPDDELPPDFVLNLFPPSAEPPVTGARSDAPPPGLAPSTPPRPVVYPQQPTEDPTRRVTGRLLRRVRYIPDQVTPEEPPAPRPPLPTPAIKPRTAPVPPPRRVEQSKPLANEPPANRNTTSLFDDLPGQPAPDDPFDPFNFSDLYSTDQLTNLPDTSDLFRDLPEFGSAKTDDLQQANVDSVLGINFDNTPSYTPYVEEAEDAEPEEAYRPDGDFDFETLLHAQRAPAYDDLPAFQETSGGQTEELSQLFDNLPVQSPSTYQFDEADRTFQNGQTIDVAPEAPHPLETLFGVTGQLSEEWQPPANNDRSNFDSLPDWFGSTNLLADTDEITEPPLVDRNGTNVLPSFDDIPALFGSTNVLDDGSASPQTGGRSQTEVLPPYQADLFENVESGFGQLYGDTGQLQYGDTGKLPPDEDAYSPPNTVLTSDEGMYALDDLVRFANNAMDNPAPDPTRETDEIPAVTPSATALLTNMNEALRPSLMLLRAQAEMLEDRIAGAMSEGEANMLRLMRDNAETALKLLDSLEQVMQLSDSALRLNVERFEVMTLLREAGKLMQDRARARRHRITVQLDDSLPPLQGDYARVLTLLTDLMDNAVRYSPVGGSSRISVDLMGSYLLFTVADTGIGLTPQDMDYIGQPFWRASHQPLVRQQPGTGLRLYLARRILEMHGGELFYSGEPNVGSSFSFTLPIGA